MPRKKLSVSWNDTEIRDLRGRRYYMRTKLTKHGSIVKLSIKTHKDGKGLTLASVTFPLISDKSMKDGIAKLSKKWRKFYIINFVPAWEME